MNWLEESWAEDSREWLARVLAQRASQLLRDCSQVPRTLCKDVLKVIDSERRSWRTTQIIRVAAFCVRSALVCDTHPKNMHEEEEV